MEEDKFFAVFSNGKYSSSDKWEDLPKNDHVKLYLHGHFHHSHTTQGGTWIPWYRYEILDETGKTLNYRIGNFEVIRIYPDSGMYNFFGRQIDILDIRQGIVHNYVITESDDVGFFYNKLTEILTKVNELGSWQAYEQSIEIKKKDKKIEDLEKYNNDLRKEMDDLKKQLLEIENKH